MREREERGQGLNTPSKGIQAPDDLILQLRPSPSHLHVFQHLKLSVQDKNHNVLNELMTLIPVHSMALRVQ